METKKDIGKVLKNRLTELNESPDLEVWSAIENELGKRRRKQKIKKVIIALICLVLVYFVYTGINSERDNSNANKVEQQKSINPKKLYNTSPIINQKNKTNSNSFNSDSKIDTNSKTTVSSNQYSESNKTEETRLETEHNNNKNIVDKIQQREAKSDSTDLFNQENSSNPTQKQTSKGSLILSSKSDKSFNNTLQKTIDNNAVESNNDNSSDNTAKLTDENNTHQNSIGNKLPFNKANEATFKRTSYNEIVKNNVSNDRSKVDYLNSYLEGKKHYSFDTALSINDTLILNTPQKEIPENSASPWSLSLVGGMNFLNTSLKENIVHKNIKTEKSNSFTESYGILMNYSLNEHTTLRFGLKKRSIRFTTNNIANSNPNIRIDSIVNINNVTPLLSDNDLITKLNNSPSFDIIEKNNYLEIPLELKFGLPKIKNFSFIGGVSHLYLLNSNIYINSNNTQEFILAKSLDARKNAFSLNLGLSYDIQLSKHFYLNFEGHYQQLLGLYKSNNLQFNTHSLNFQAGFTFKF
ncbi:hypothetical protein [Tenacibaculum sp. 190524A05c]|uniref:hypothetical protein n=1 Tax=Tenacibaculum platacis TaxID=3137852 RepID=UPI0031FAC407